MEGQRRQIALGSKVLAHGLKQKTWFNDEVLRVQSFDSRTQRYVCTRQYPRDFSSNDYQTVGAFKEENLRALTKEEVQAHKEAKVEKQAALYDPNGPHPPKKRTAEDVSSYIVLFQAMCPNVTQYSVPNDCCNCGKTAEDAGLEKLKFCSRCKMAPFCSKECQIAQWPLHKQYCTTRTRRVDMLLARILEAPWYRNEVWAATNDRIWQHSTKPEVLEMALDIADEFVDGAFVLISFAVLQSGSFGILDESAILESVRHICNMRLSSGSFMKLAEAMDLAEKLERNRKAHVADFQKMEADMVSAREKALSVWTKMRHQVRNKGDDEPGFGGSLLISSSSSVKEVCEYRAERCRDVRLDKGNAVMDFLLLLDFVLLSLHLGIRSEDTEVEEQLWAVRRELSDDLTEAWLEYIRAFEGEKYVLERDPLTALHEGRNRAMTCCIYLGIEASYRNADLNLSLTEEDIQNWLGEEKGRWLPSDYEPNGKYSFRYTFGSENGIDTTSLLRSAV